MSQKATCWPLNNKKIAGKLFADIYITANMWPGLADTI